LNEPLCSPISDLTFDSRWQHRILALITDQDNFIVPVRWVLRKLGPEAPMGEAALTRFFESDARFQIFDGLDIEAEGGPITQFSLAEQESMGIYQGPKVMLRDRVPSKEEIMAFLINKADQTYAALLRAWETRPNKDGHAEDRLLDALAKAQKLKRELRETLNA